MVRIIAEPLLQEDVPFEDAFKSAYKQRNDKTRLIFQPPCAIDGEGVTIGPKHFYVELNAYWPGGRRLLKGSDLGPHEIFDFLFQLPEKHNYVVFGASYDFNMWLRYLPRQVKIDLCTTNRAIWGAYKIKWIDRKYLELWRGKKHRKIYDVIPWYQKPFVTTLEDWNIGTPEERELIARMKKLRGNFANVDPAEIEAYCWLECERLVDLVNKLCRAIQETPYRPTALYGPGALAEAIFKYEKIDDYSGPYDKRLSLHAYYGGRFDTVLFGIFDSVHEYDIRSAYPDQIRYLPCLRHAHWQRSIDPAISRYGLYRVKWDVGIDCLYPPFPYRDSSGCIWYLYAGQGWYHADEVRAAQEIFGDKIQVIQGKALIEGCDHQPFAFVERLYKWRQKIAKQNYAQGTVVKLSLNSMYGKLVQSVGKPPFQNFFWGGAITAGTRAKILRVIGPKMPQIVSIATDGLISLEQLKVAIGTDLGEWEYHELLSHIQVSNGVYHSVQKDSTIKERARGIGHGEMDWQKITDIYYEHGVAGSYGYQRSSRFITIREALHLNDPSVECTWRVEDRKLNFEPTRMEVTGLTIEGKEPPLQAGDIVQFRGTRYNTQDLVDMKMIPKSSSLSYPFKEKNSWKEQQELREYYQQRGQDDGDIFS